MVVQGEMRGKGEGDGGTRGNEEKKGGGGGTRGNEGKRGGGWWYKGKWGEKGSSKAVGVHVDGTLEQIHSFKFLKFVF